MQRKNFQKKKLERTLLAIALLVFFVLALSSGCQYTVEGNPDIDLTEVHVSPIAAGLEPGGTLMLTASVLGYSHSSGVSWSVEGTNNGTIIGNGLSAVYTAPASAASSVINVKVTSEEDPNRSVEVPITLEDASGSFASSPDVVTLLTGAQQQFTIDSESAVPPLRWEILTGAGSITDSGLYTAPSIFPADSLPTIIGAISLIDSTVFSQSLIRFAGNSDSTLCFTRDILPVLSANCGMSGCHDAAGHAAGYNYNTYDGSIHSVEPGNARNSRLYIAITQFEANSRMPPPPAPALSPNEVLKIGEWIDEGALDCQ
ncbi:MAG TPA: c-type cytochrome domain-containing protein [Candidatus Kapabacteria bacterium]|jgi:hypothetical protein